MGPATPLRGPFNQNGSSRRRSLFSRHAIFLFCGIDHMSDSRWRAWGLGQTVAVTVAAGLENNVRMYRILPTQFCIQQRKHVDLESDLKVDFIVDFVLAL